MIYYNQSPPWGQFNRFINDQCLEKITAFIEAEAQMTKEEREVFRLVYRKELPRTTVAKMLGIAESTVRYRLSKAEKKVKEHPVIVRTQRIYEAEVFRVDDLLPAKEEPVQDVREHVLMGLERLFSDVFFVCQLLSPPVFSLSRRRSFLPAS
ncbi:MAG: hypothetical protein K6E30_07095 [Lachnospiraceae bacterium]|nr:hypothetical protein [Lachnospiraceae bacterium]